MKSGRIVERRLQVLTTRLPPPSRAIAALAMRCWSTNGPFLMDRDIWVPLLLSPGNDETPRRLLLRARLLALRRLAPRRDRMTTLRLPFAAAVRVIDRVHRGTARGRTD